MQYRSVQMIRLLASNGYDMHDFANLLEDIAKLSQKDEQVSEEEEKENNLYRKVTDILKRIQFPFNMKGYDYVKEAIVEKYKNPKKKFHNDIYSSIAEKYQTTTLSVDAGIRHALNRMQEGMTKEELKKLFGVPRQLTNKEFIHWAVAMLH